MKKWIIRILLGLLASAVLLVGVIYAWGGMIINRKYESEPRKILIAARPEMIDRGERLAQVYGCHKACHGEDMEGEVFFEGWAVGRIISPSLTTAIDRYSTTELEAIIRQGVFPDGRSVLAMPSASFAAMTDRDLSAVLAFIAGYPKQDNDLGYSSYGLLPRLGLVIGEFKPSAAMVENSPWPSDALDEPLGLGEYMALMNCSECHGMDFAGQGEFTAPLTVARAYSLPDFKRLMKTGLGLDKRDLGLMSTVAKHRFSRMTEAEVEALYRFLTTL